MAKNKKYGLANIKTNNESVHHREITNVKILRVYMFMCVYVYVSLGGYLICVCVYISTQIFNKISYSAL